MPSEIRKAEKLKEEDEFPLDSLGEGVLTIKKIDLRLLLEEAIEKQRELTTRK